MMELLPWHQNNWQQVVSRIELQRLPHAVLLTGSAGLGKTLFAYKMAESLLCIKPGPLFHACGNCHSCQLFQAGNHPDHIIIQAEASGKSIKIDQIRSLIDKQTLTPSIANWKTVIIESADLMTNSAANSLLKLLEEPQKNTLLILVSHRLHQLPLTIRSRCQQINMIAPVYSETVAWLQTQGIDTDIEQLTSIAPLTQNAPFKIVEALKTNEWQHYQLIQQNFEQLLQQRGNPVQLAVEWQQYDLLKVMHQLLSSIVLKIKQFNYAENDSHTLQQHWRIVDCIVRTIKLISSQNNYNKTLLIEDFMVSVMRITSPNPSSS